MVIKIIKNKRLGAWYKDKIGQVFEVLKEVEYADEGKVYVVWQDGCIGAYVLPEDCEIIND